MSTSKKLLRNHLIKNLGYSVSDCGNKTGDQLREFVTRVEDDLREDELLAAEELEHWKEIHETKKTRQTKNKKPTRTNQRARGK